MTIDENSTAEGIAVGTIVHDVFDEGVRFIVMRGPFHWCAYVGVPEAHPLAGHSYDDLSPVSAHGGLTFSGGGKQWPEGYYWYGWDYGHSGDASYFEGKAKKVMDDVKREIRGARVDTDKHWTLKEVIADSWSTIYDFKALMHLAEAIAKKKS